MQVQVFMCSSKATSVSYAEAAMATAFTLTSCSFSNRAEGKPAARWAKRW